MPKKKNPYVLIRGTGCGVVVGELVSDTPAGVVLTAARQCWSWKTTGIGTYAELSQYGPAAGSRIGCAMPEIKIRQEHVVGIVGCSPDAEKKLREYV